MIKILLITNKSDITTDFIVKKLTKAKANFYRLNTEEIGNSVDICFNYYNETFLIIDKRLNIEIDITKIESVYFRRPEIKEYKDKGLTSGDLNFLKSETLFSLEGLYRILDNAFWINNVYHIRNAENKLFQLLLAKDIGFIIPNSIITNNPKKAYEFYLQNQKTCIIKPIKSGLIQGEKEEGVIFTNKVRLTKESSERVQLCPVYLQRLVKKEGDVRITVIANKIFATFINSQQKKDSRIDWRKGVMPLEHTKMTIPRSIEKKCCELTKRLNLTFAAIDFVIDENNNYVFLEINPNGQWAWIEKRTGYNISEQISNLLIKNVIS